MEGRRKDVMEKLKELRVMREDLKAMRRSLEEIKTLVKEGIAKTREEREVRRRGMERNKREKGGSKEEIPRKLEMESRRKERRKEVG